MNRILTILMITAFLSCSDEHVDSVIKTERMSDPMEMPTVAEINDLTQVSSSAHYSTFSSEEGYYYVYVDFYWPEIELFNKGVFTVFWRIADHSPDLTDIEFELYAVQDKTEYIDKNVGVNEGSFTFMVNVSEFAFPPKAMLMGMMKAKNIHGEDISFTSRGFILDVVPTPLRNISALSEAYIMQDVMFSCDGYLRMPAHTIDIRDRSFFWHIAESPSNNGGRITPSVVSDGTDRYRDPAVAWAEFYEPGRYVVELRTQQTLYVPLQTVSVHEIIVKSFEISGPSTWRNNSYFEYAVETPPQYAVQWDYPGELNVSHTSRVDTANGNVKHIVSGYFGSQWPFWLSSFPPRMMPSFDIKCRITSAPNFPNTPHVTEVVKKVSRPSMVM